ncbi:hypothetical protein, partial [Endozoicomonas sp. ONNA2]|uniref:hypothetical protein n=1 Tax=Endozoicomonas sp. ONNA2 TaxID=2828741 RepID=UPI0021494001
MKNPVYLWFSLTLDLFEFTVTEDTPKTIGYLRVSSADQDLKKNKSDILLLGNCLKITFPFHSNSGTM